MPTRPVKQVRSLKIGSPNWFVLFNDSEVILKAKFSWDANDHITAVDMELTNLASSPIQYEICKLQRCLNTYPSSPDYLVIHISTQGGQIVSTDSHQFNPPVKFDTTGDKFTFIFKESNLACDSSGNYNCQFPGGTPDTKDGAIIIGS